MAGEYAALIHAGLSAQHFKIQHLKHAVRDGVKLRHKTVFRIKPAELGVVLHLTQHMAAVRAVGQVDDRGYLDRTILFGDLHLEQPLERGFLPFIQPRQPVCQCIELK